MKLEKDISLKSYNTFGIDVNAHQFISVQNEEELLEILKRFYASELFVLGGGSNMLLTQNINKTVLHINLKGIEVIEDQEDHVLIKACAGENWHDFVDYCLDHNYGGLENLSLIPGNVGTSPIQNIGAYGVELKDVMAYCETINRQSLSRKRFYTKDCLFGYRDSIFKSKFKNQFIITSVVFKLSKNNHQLHIDYGSIKTELDAKGITSPTIQEVSKAVIAIRESKLPNPKEIGNSGSFFKNPILDHSSLNAIQNDYPDVPYYEIDENAVKIPAGWLIEKAGLKGYRKGDAGVHTKQALVLVNYGSASGKEIENVAKRVQKEVKRKFNIDLETEVNVF
ncbi:UDP-N-acetylmuramate dehydrogenase [Psychroflexus sp. YR1-1]|uniref:UDP-N-acetylenolpyruvoylglucosamine reductase n=1 Tax=Psychroflexus aurantiacus TaxID=2709310 RepID=A0A6B3QZS2_9FLAO|nr:UDP-N-acetylmuramate dehydrogenase [Psychroflexus aurantiacus]NEV93268.1 UDP-N-acetylmuramate dehydrogenase [Psychroflexus aurantiacus]